MAKVTIKPIEPLVMEFADGTVKEALFNSKAFIIFTEEFGKLDDEALKSIEQKPYDFTAKILHCGMKVVDNDATLDEAKSIAIGGGEELAAMIMNLVIDNFMAVADEDSKKKFMKEIKKFNKQIAG